MEGTDSGDRSKRLFAAGTFCDSDGMDTRGLLATSGGIDTELLFVGGKTDSGAKSPELFATGRSDCSPAACVGGTDSGGRSKRLFAAGLSKAGCDSGGGERGELQASSGGMDTEVGVDDCSRSGAGASCAMDGEVLLVSSDGTDTGQLALVCRDNGHRDEGAIESRGFSVASLGIGLGDCSRSGADAFGRSSNLVEEGGRPPCVSSSLCLFPSSCDFLPSLLFLADLLKTSWNVCSTSSKKSNMPKESPSSSQFPCLGCPYGGVGGAIQGPCGGPYIGCGGIQTPG